MADSTSRYTVMRRPIPIEILTPDANVKIELGSLAQGQLQAFASMSPDTINEVRTYLALAFRSRIELIVAELEVEVDNLFELGRGNDLQQVLPRLRQVMEAMAQMQRFDEGPFSDPRIDGFGPLGSDPISQVVAKEATKQVNESPLERARRLAAMAFNVSAELSIEDDLEVPEADVAIHVGDGEPPRILSKETEVGTPSIYGDMGRYTERQPRSRAIGDIDRGLYGNRRRHPRRHSE